MKQLTGKWKVKKDGSMVLKWKKRRVKPLSILDIVTIEE